MHPDNYDIKEIISDIVNIENLLFPGDKSNRPIISFNIDEGSVKQIYKTSIQYIVGFTAILQFIKNSNNIDSLDINTAKAIEVFQEAAIKKDYNFVIKTSQHDTPELIIDKNTNYFRSEDIWIETEFYFYGKITNAGGKDKANIHVFIPDKKTIIIQTPQEILERLEKNILYKNYGVRATGKQNIDTGEIENLNILELIDFNAKYETDYLNRLRTKAKHWIKEINPDTCLNAIRGRNEK